MEKPKPSPIRIEDDSMPLWLMVIFVSAHIFAIGMILFAIVKQIA